MRRYDLPVRGTRAGPQLAVLRGDVPAVLVEVGYVSNPRDAAVLNQPAFLAAAAEALAAGVAAFRDARPAGTTPVRQAMLAPAGVYFVRPGDTIAAIAAQMGLSGETLARLNPASLLQPLLPGQPLHVEEAPPTESAGCRKHQYRYFAARTGLRAPCG